jgi:transcriptional regulator
MKVQSIRVSCRLSHNYNSYESEVTVQIEEGDDLRRIKKELFDGCKRDCAEQILIQMREK